MTAANLRLPAAELSKLEPVRSRHAERAVAPAAAQPVRVPRRLRHAVREVVGYART
jgi:hypothetical protein